MSSTCGSIYPIQLGININRLQLFLLPCEVVMSIGSRLLYYNINYADCLESEVDDRTTFIIYDIYGMTEIYGTYRFL